MSRRPKGIPQRFWMNLDQECYSKQHRASGVCPKVHCCSILEPRMFGHVTLINDNLSTCSAHQVANLTT